MATAAAKKHIELALALPPRLRTFLARYPPVSILPESQQKNPALTAYQKESPNPFKATKHPVTGNWHNPKYSLRRQAELVKMAREHGVEDLMPFSEKAPEERLRKRVELGLRVKGTGVGERVKGHKHERTMISKYALAVLLLGALLWWLGIDVLTGRDYKQDGEEERGHAQDARAHQGMEEGKRIWECIFTKVRKTNTRATNRSERRTGPGSPNRRPDLVPRGKNVYRNQCTIITNVQQVQEAIPHQSIASVAKTSPH